MSLTNAPESLNFSRYADVVQALHHPQLLPQGSAALRAETDAGAQAATPAAPVVPLVDPQAVLRSAVREALAPAQLAAWRQAFTTHARALVDGLSEGMPLDLVSALAEPWALECALVVTGAAREQAVQCAALARGVYLAAAQAEDGTPGEDALNAVLALARLLAGPASMPGAMADVQTFVALSQTLPALLAGAWRVLLCDPAALATLMAAPHTVASCVGELLRLGSPARAVFREAAQDLQIGTAAVQRGKRVALLLWAANRDPARFAHPEQLDLARDSAGQLGLGMGLHHCAGAALVRMAVSVCTEALLERSAGLALVDAAESAVIWRVGFAMRSPASLWVVRQRALARP